MSVLEIEDIALEDIDVSRPELFRDDTWRPLFARLRREAPVHHQANSANGAFWSVTTHSLIKQVDTRHDVFSSEAGGISIVDAPTDESEATPESQIENFIAMDPPRHDEQRRTVSPAVAPSNLAYLEPVIRERVVDILDHLPVGETFNWVDQISVELTARMLATLFDFPYEERRKLVHWSDITTDIPQVTGNEGTDLQARHEELMRCAEAFYQLWHERAAQPPKADLISMLAHGESTKDMHESPALFLGNRLAEMQLRVLWEEIMQRFHSIELVGDVIRLPNNFIRGISEVPVKLHPR